MSPNPSSTTPTARRSSPTVEKTKVPTEPRKPRSQNSTVTSTTPASTSYPRVHQRPGLVPTPVVGWPTAASAGHMTATGHMATGHMGTQWPYAYLGSTPMIQHQRPMYTYQPAHYVQIAQGAANAAAASERLRSGSDSYNHYQNPPLPGEKLSKTNLYIRGLHASTTDEDLVAMCKQYGNIISTKAILDKDVNNKCKGGCKGYGFVDYDNPISAQRAVAALQAKGIQAQMARQQEQDPTNLYLSNLPKHLDEQQLQQLLTQYGNVISTRILRDNNGMSKGVGFARLESKENCQAVIDKLHGQYLAGSTESLLCKFADGGPKKNKNGEDSPGWTNRQDMNYVSYDMVRRSPVSTSQALSTGGTQPSPRVTPVMPGQMAMATQAMATPHMQAYSIASGGVNWVQPGQAYNIAVSPHQLPVSPSPVDQQSALATQQHMQQQQQQQQQSHQAVMPQLAAQMSHMHLHAGAAGQQYVGVQTIAGYQPQANTWQMSQPHPQAVSHEHVSEASVIMTASEVDSAYSHSMHAAAAQQASAAAAHQQQLHQQSVIEHYGSPDQDPNAAAAAAAAAAHAQQPRVVYAPAQYAAAR